MTAAILFAVLGGVSVAAGREVDRVCLPADLAHYDYNDANGLMVEASQCFEA